MKTFPIRNPDGSFIEYQEKIQELQTWHSDEAEKLLEEILNDALVNLEMGYWYIRCSSDPGYFIAYIIQNQLSEESEWMVFMTDREGCCSIDDIGIENFIKKVPDPI